MKRHLRIALPSHHGKAAHLPQFANEVFRIC